jgi:hypothetical protein
MTAFLDVRPMITALRTTPEDFRLSGMWLNHEPSQHNFQFDPDGRVGIQAACNCALYAIQPEQEVALRAAYRRWYEEYWRPLQLNLEFASHFPPRSPARRVLIRVTARLHSWLVRPEGHIAVNISPADSAKSLT